MALSKQVQDILAAIKHVASHEHGGYEGMQNPLLKQEAQDAKAALLSDLAMALFNKVKAEILESGLEGDALVEYIQELDTEITALDTLPTGGVFGMVHRDLVPKKPVSVFDTHPAPTTLEELSTLSMLSMGTPEIYELNIEEITPAAYAKKSVFRPKMTLETALDKGMKRAESILGNEYLYGALPTVLLPGAESSYVATLEELTSQTQEPPVATSDDMAVAESSDYLGRGVAIGASIGAAVTVGLTFAFGPVGLIAGIALTAATAYVGGEVGMRMSSSPTFESTPEVTTARLASKLKEAERTHEGAPKLTVEPAPGAKAGVDTRPDSTSIDPRAGG